MLFVAGSLLFKVELTAVIVAAASIVSVRGIGWNALLWALRQRRLRA
jgi:hypothetical protein